MLYSRLLGEGRVDGASSDGMWAPVEEWVGGPLPEEYKTLVERYGDGVISGHLFVPHPGGNMGLLQFMQEEREGLWESYESLKWRLDPRVLEAWETVVPWAYHDWDGDTCFLLPPVSGDLTEVWNVGIAFRQCPQFVIFDGGVGEFLRGMLAAGEYPRGWPSNRRPSWMPVDDPRRSRPPE